MIEDKSLDAQLALIGCMLIQPEISGEVLQQVRQEDFSDAALRSVYEAARQVFLSGRATDPVLVRDSAGKEYTETLRDAMNAVGSVAFWEDYAGIVREGGALRRMQAAGLHVAGCTTAAEARAALAEAEGLVSDRPSLRLSPIGDSVGEFVDRMRDKKRPNYLPWGFRFLEQRLTAEEGDFLLIGADSSVGKTALATQLAWSIARGGRKVGFFSLETSCRKLTDRIVAQQARISLKDIKDHALSDDELMGVSAWQSDAARTPLEIVEAAGYSVADLRSLTLSRQYKVIFADYVQLLSAPGKDRWEIVTSVSMDLHRLAQELGVAVIGLSQITAPDKKTKAAPDKDSLRESRQLKQDADAILMLSLDDPNDPASIRWLDIAKNKDGPLGNFALAFDPRYMSFHPVDSRDWKIWRQKKDAEAKKANPFGAAEATDAPTPFEQEALPF